MKHPVTNCLLLVLFLLQTLFLYGQQRIFNRIQPPGMEPAITGSITGIAQDHLGYMWILAKTKGLIRYDGSHIVTYSHSNDSTSITATLECIAIDADNNLWLGSFGNGMDKFDRATNKFFHFRHNANNAASLANDTVTSILQDRSGNLWIGTYKGLDLYEKETGKFIHHPYKVNDPQSLSSNHVRVVYEDKQGTLWIGCGTPFSENDSSVNEGGLNRFDKTTGKFTRFVHELNDKNSIENNKVKALFEDSKGNFWVGTAGDGLHIMNRQTGTFTHYYYDSTHPHNLSRPPVHKEFPGDHITFIKEDAGGKIWIGSFAQGINVYESATKKLTHYGIIMNSTKTLVADTLTGFTDNQAWASYISRDGVLWISTLSGSLFNVNPFNKTTLKYSEIDSTRFAFTFYKETNGALWIGTDSGLVYKNPEGGIKKFFYHDVKNINSLSSNEIAHIIQADDSSLWIAAFRGGLDRFYPATNKFSHYEKDTIHAASLSSNLIEYLYIAQDKDLWIATDSGLYRMSRQTKKFFYYKPDSKDSNSLGMGVVCIAEDKANMWAATPNGLDQLNKQTGKIKHYLMNTNVRGVYVDVSGVVWAGTYTALYKYDSKEKNFAKFQNSTNTIIDKVISITEDKKLNLWVRTGDALFVIDKTRENVRIFDAENGFKAGMFVTPLYSYQAKDGELFFGYRGGYFSVFPENISANDNAPEINLTSLQIGGSEILPGSNSILSKPIYQTNEIKLARNQNSFSIGFIAIHYNIPGEEKYLYMLENYDNTWHEANADNKAYFYNLNPGHYTLRIKAVNPNGVWNEKKLSIIINPPWWQTWWALLLAALTFIAMVWGFFYYRSQRLREANRLLENKVARRTAQLEQSLQELKSTQAQLIQSEKMASLGELTAGIAHEIQNPLNFINNFSEVNNELIDELQEEADKGNIDEVKIIANDIKENGQKINHHGKRADAIVKGMLQHSRTNTGQKELIDINALAGEYLRLAYHGLRAKDKDFNAAMQTDYEESIGKLNVIPQDIGRVLLNLYTNAFYAVNEKKKLNGEGYEPIISVITKKLNGKVEIRIKDNGNGISQKVLNKIFQPFFTTKPTGEGTGLGLSLSYDIIKAHGGELIVETKEGEYAEFIIQLPS